MFLPMFAMYCLIFSYAGNWIATWLIPAKEGKMPLFQHRKNITDIRHKKKGFNMTEFHCQ